jgi:hypothetical protein
MFVFALTARRLISTFHRYTSVLLHSKNRSAKVICFNWTTKKNASIFSRNPDH